MGSTHKTDFFPHPQWRILVVKVKEAVIANDPKLLPKKGTKYSECNRQLFPLDYNKGLFRDYIYAYQSSQSSPEGDILLYFAPPPELVPVYLEKMASSQVGKLRWPEITQTFFLPRDEFTTLEPLLEPPPELGHSWTRLYGEQVDISEPFSSSYVEFRVTWQDHSNPIYDYDSDAQTGIVIPKKVEIVPADEPPSGGNVKQTTIGNNWALRETRAPDEDSMKNYVRGFPDFQALSLPAVLNGVTVRWSESEGSGNSVSGGSIVAVGFPYGASLSTDNSTVSSASMSPSLSFDRTEARAITVPGIRYFFYLPSDLSISDILDKLSDIVGSTVNVWPNFVEVSHTISVLGVRLSVRANAARSGSVSCEDEDATRYTQSTRSGIGEDYDISTSAGTINIPASIHGAISFSGDASRTIELKAEAEAGITASGYPITIPGGESISVVEKSISASVQPSSLPATSPSSIPSTGYYVHPRSIQTDIYDDQWTRVTAVVFNASSI